MLGKVVNGALSYAPRKIIIDGKTIFNPPDTFLKEQGYKDVETTEAPAVSTQTQQAVPTWQDQENKIVQTWELKPAQPDPTAALQKFRRRRYWHRSQSLRTRHSGSSAWRCSRSMCRINSTIPEK